MRKMKAAKEKKPKSSNIEKLRHGKKMEMKKKRTKGCVAAEKRAAEEKPEKKIRREITSLDDEELWAGFETEETDRILRGEIKPRILIASCYVLSRGDGTQVYPQRGPFIAEMLRSVLPNSAYLERRINAQSNYHLFKILGLAKKKGCTSLILAHTNGFGHDVVRIISLLNGATGEFGIFFPPQIMPNLGNRMSHCPDVFMANFTSPSDVGTGRLIQSLFPKVRPSPRRTSATFMNLNGFITFRHHRHNFEEGLAGKRGRVRLQECGPRFVLELKCVSKVAFDTGGFECVFKTPQQHPVTFEWDSKPPQPGPWMARF